MTFRRSVSKDMSQNIEDMITDVELNERELFPLGRECRAESKSSSYHSHCEKVTVEGLPTTLAEEENHDSIHLSRQISGRSSDSHHTASEPVVCVDEEGGDG